MKTFVVNRLAVDQALSKTDIRQHPKSTPEPAWALMQASEFGLHNPHGGSPHVQASLRQRDMRIRVAL
ncbi:hypothetical protein [uncultured Tateyamaria sp.]|uniref:hypothetical protein n=1 Tax=uncultured Tateyamaria sp. TaxID=455651 RepID=UPI00263409F4|nr:hypothetical protein [uncultured Tateyamaria sp.]